MPKFSDLTEQATPLDADLIAIEQDADGVSKKVQLGNLPVVADLVTAINDLASTDNGKGASLVAIEDAATNFTAVNVEDALTELFLKLDGIDQWVSATSYIIGDVIWLSDNNKIYRCIIANSDVTFIPANWVLIGGAGGGVGDAYTIHLIQADDLTDVNDIDLTGNNTEADGGGIITPSALTISTTPADFIKGVAQSIHYDPNADGSDDYFGFTKFIPQGLRGRSLGFSFEFKNDATTVDNDFRFWVKQKDGLLAGNIEYFNMPAFNGSDNVSIPFNTDSAIATNCTEIEFGWQNKSATTTVELSVDNILVSSRPFVYKNLINTQTIRVLGANGFGSTDTKIRAFSTLVEDTGEGLITRATSAANGDTYTINRAGKYTISYCDLSTGSVHFGLSLNSSQLTTGIEGITNADRIIIGRTVGNNVPDAMTVELDLVVGDVIRAHSETGAGVPTNPEKAHFTISGTVEEEHVITPAKSNIERLYIDGYDSKDGSNYVLFDQAHTTGNYVSTLNKLAVESTSTNSKVTASKKVMAFISCSASRASSTHDYRIVKLNSSNAVVETSYTQTLTANAPNVSMVTILEKDESIVIVSDQALLDNSNSQVSIVLVDFEQSLLSAIPTQRTAYVKDEKTAAGGTSSTTTVHTRDLNVLSGDTSFISLDSNQITLQPGKYNIEASTPCYKSDETQAFLYNISDSAIEIEGSSEFTVPSSTVQTRSSIVGTVEITSTKTFEIRHWIKTAQAGDGLGIRTDNGTNNISTVSVYTIVKIVKVK